MKASAVYLEAARRVDIDDMGPDWHIDDISGVPVKHYLRNQPGAVVLDKSPLARRYANYFRPSRMREKKQPAWSLLDFDKKEQVLSLLFLSEIVSDDDTEYPTARQMRAQFNAQYDE